jgi:outer membrane protein insertion porin family
MTSKLISLPLCFVLLILASPIAAQQDFTIQKIEFEGLNRVTAEEAISTAGLKVGERFVLPSLDAAAQKLMDSGLFNKVGYKTRAANQQITIIFQVEEATVTSSRVIFDNFIWFDDTELIGAIKRELPSFTGTAPDSGDTTERIVKALQRFLHENKIEATVTHMASQDTAGSSTQEHIFTVNGVSMPICSMHFPGAKNVTEETLIKGAKELKGADYSRKFVSLFAANSLVAIYREVGQLKATFAPPAAKPEATANCKSGVEITIPVDEGYIYKWDRAEWSGNNAYSAQELDALLQMKAGEVVNGVKLDQAPQSVKKLYGRKGFLLARIQSQPEFDDQAQTVAYKMTVIEGPQFKMGNFIVKGFSESETKSLQSRWELKPGDVYDEEYTNSFSKTRMEEALRSLFMRRQAEGKTAPPSLKWLPKPDRQSLTVDVTLELTN